MVSTICCKSAVLHKSKVNNSTNMSFMFFRKLNITASSSVLGSLVIFGCGASLFIVSLL